MELLVKASAGAVVVVIISLLARSSSFYLAGLVPVFPTFTLIAHYTVGLDHTATQLKATVLFTMWSVIPYMLYLISMYLLVEHVRMQVALGISVGVWVAAAVALIVLWGKYHAA